MNTGIVYVC